MPELLAHFLLVTGQDPGQQIADYVILICSNGRRWGVSIHNAVSLLPKWLNDFEENKPVSPGMPELLAHFLLPFGTPAMKCSKLACLAYFVTGQDPGQQIADYVILICSNGRSCCTSSQMA
jgi:hypothetical protein